jgi:putative FmdB family regulatory protein
MPLFEYTCAECNHHFEALVSGDRKPVCPSCNSSNLEKELSRFAVSTKGGQSMPLRNFSPGACGTCGDPRGPGSCSMN